jgi:protein SCO1
MTRTSSIIHSTGLPLALIAASLIWYFGEMSVQRGAASLVEGSPPVRIGGRFTLTDQDGMRRTDKDFRGKYMLVFFGYTYCPDDCPTTLALMRTALDELAGRANQVVPILISVDPKRDTPEKLKRYLTSFGPRFVGLTGNDKEVADAAKAYRVFYHANSSTDGDYTVDHSGILYLMGPDGAFVSHYTPDTSPDLLANDLKNRMLPHSPAG